MTTVRLVIGPRSFLDATTPISGTEGLLVVDVPSVAHSDVELGGATPNSVIVRWNEGSVVLAATSLAGRPVTSEVPLAWRDLFERMVIRADVRDLIKDGTGEISEPAPLFLLLEQGGEIHVFGRIRFSFDDALFIRLTDEPLPSGGAVDLWTLITAGTTSHRAHALFLNNHQCYYFRMFPGEEIEHKYTLAGGADIWSATVGLYDELREGSLSGFVMEYGDEFQTWDYMNHLFEVSAPAAERGYISFIPLSTGGYTIKRKWFDADATRRGERHYKEPAEIEDRATYLADRFSVNATELPAFRRVRYDVNFESLATGHVYGVFFDHSRLTADPSVVLVQCELEYIRTRAVVPVAESQVLAELELVALWLERFLERHGLASDRGIYSKLSFLRDSVSADPRLAQAKASA